MCLHAGVLQSGNFGGHPRLLLLPRDCCLVAGGPAFRVLHGNSHNIFPTSLAVFVLRASSPLAPDVVGGAVTGYTVLVGSYKPMLRRLDVETAASVIGFLSYGEIGKLTAVTHQYCRLDVENTFALTLRLLYWRVLVKRLVSGE